jgi:methylated-DNA-[protein]-cysteine S-methyltransferase
MEKTYYTYMDSPVGRLLLAGNEKELRHISFPRGKGALKPERGWVPKEEPFREAIRQLQAYFAGTLKEFDLPLAPQGTPFQRAVWQVLRSIPYGATASYGQIARRIGKPKAMRAVGAANGRNPLPIVVPCHRVIGSDGSLTGFGGGLTTKQKLLDLERRHATPKA